MNYCVKKSIYALCLFILASCGKSARVLQSNYQSQDFQISIDGPGAGELLLHYTGSGGAVIQHNSTVLLVDPFFSNTNLLPVAMKALFGGYLKQKEKSIRHGIQRSPITFNGADAVLITHAHYDHLMDVPWLYSKGILDQKTTPVLGNNTMTKLLNHYQITETIDMEGRATSGSAYKGIGGVRILPILSQHAAHVGHIKAFTGEYNGQLRRKGALKSHISDWREGKTLAYLVDFLDGDDIDFRLFIQTSSSDAPLGLPPKKLLNQRSVDLAILGVASYHNSNDYPKFLITQMNPSAVLFVHWENFFQGYRKEKPRTVIGTDVKAFPGLVDQYYNRKNFQMVKPGVTMTVKY